MALLSFISSSAETVAADSISAATGAAEGATAELSVWELCLQGGWIMIPLVVLSIVCIYIFIERFMVIKKS